MFTSGNWKFSCLNWPRDLQNRSRSSIFELNQDTLEIHPWYKFGTNAINYLLSYRVYQRKLKIVMFKLTPVTSKIGQGHPSSNLTKTLLRYIHGISFGSMRLIFVELSCLQAKCWRTDGQTDGQTDRQTDRRTDQSNSRVGYTQPAQKI